VTADVVVVGYGAAALAAAITAADAGADVVMLEKATEALAGGNTRVSGNSWFSPTSVEDAMTFLHSLSGDYPLPEPVVRAWAEEMYLNNGWVESLGAEPNLMTFEPEHPELPGHECDLGLYHLGPEWGHSRLWLHLTKVARERGIEVLFATRAVDLLQRDGSSEVIGVVAERDGETIIIEARRGVVLASGGFANNAEMARDFLRLPSAHPWGSPANTGDGLKMAIRAGADLAHMHQFTGRPGLKAPDYTTCFHVSFYDGDSWIFVDSGGRRFIDETVRLRHGKIMKGGRLVPPFPDIFHAVFDEATRLAGPIVAPLEVEPMGWTTLVEGYRWSTDNSVEIERGWIRTADSLPELATQMGADPETLERTVAGYNEHCRAGADPDFGRDPFRLAPIDQPPFYSWTWGPMVIFTGGGPRKDERTRVIDTEGEPIPRLYAAGEVSATYSWGLSGGMMIGDAMASGRIAGRNVVLQPVRDYSEASA
jgi:succinate dehydrogenase/fumarate reductase flavoprotein subunit